MYLTFPVDLQDREIVITETPTHLHRRFDPESGLPLIDRSNLQAP
jgi:hypothetical protein